MWEHKPRKHSQVVDALSRKEVFVAVYSVSKLETDFFDKIRFCATNDSLYFKWMVQVQYDTKKGIGSRTIYSISKGRESLYQIKVDCAKT